MNFIPTAIDCKVSGLPACLDKTCCYKKIWFHRFEKQANVRCDGLIRRFKVQTVAPMNSSGELFASQSATFRNTRKVSEREKSALEMALR